MTTTTIESQVALEAKGRHHHHPDHRLFGLILFLVAEGMIFFGLFSAYLIYFATIPQWPFGIELDLFLPSINTLILISSSFVMHQGQRAIKKDDVRVYNSGLASPPLWGLYSYWGKVTSIPMLVLA